MIALSFAALFLVVGVGMLGGAIFGCLRNRRLGLLGMTLVAWTLAAAFLLTGCTSSPQTAAPTEVATVVPPTSAPTVAPATLEPTVAATPAATVVPTAEASATTAPEATVTDEMNEATNPGSSSPLPTPTEEPTLEPMHGRMLFASERSGNFDIWEMDLSAPEKLTRLTDNRAADVEPRWSHDGKHIVFSSGRDDPNGINEIYTMNSDGSDQKRLVAWPNSYEWGAVYSTDDKWIAFTTTKDGKYEIYLVPADGSAAPLNLTQNDFLDSYPDWSPDGRWLAFVSDRSGNYDIWKMDVQACLAARQEGAAKDDPRCNATQLTTNPDDDFFPRWSPDGKRIVFESRQNSNRDIYVMDADGGNVARLTTDPERDTTPFWVDDGRFIVYSHDYLPNLDLHVVRPDGSGDHRLTNFPGEDRYGDWRP